MLNESKAVEASVDGLELAPIPPFDAGAAAYSTVLQGRKPSHRQLVALCQVRLRQRQRSTTAKLRPG